MTTRVITICEECDGSGLERCAANLDIPAKQHHKYIICKTCNGEGVPNDNAYGTRLNNHKDKSK